MVIRLAGMARRLHCSSGMQTTPQRTVTLPGSWPWSKVVEVLGTRVAMSAMRGKPSPVAAAVLLKLEGC